jgi:Protein of unknown function (DUF4231)
MPAAIDAEPPAAQSRTSQRRRVLQALTRVPRFELEEIEQLSELIVRRLGEWQPKDAEKHQAWVASRFRYPLRSLLIKANGNAALYVATTLVVVAGGFATSGIAAAAGAAKGSSSAWVVFGIGLLVALAGAISQQFRFGFRSSQRLTLAVSLREEGWHFVYLTGDYSLPTQDAFPLFQTRVDDIHRRMAQVGELETTPVQKASATRRRAGATSGRPAT